MACPLCIMGTLCGGGIGGYFGINPPEDVKGRIASTWATVNLVSITFIALKAMFDISLCKSGASTLENVARVVVKTFIVGVIYSLGVNYVLGRWIFPPAPKEKLQEELPPPAPKQGEKACCCQNNPIENVT